ncbi:hypothetical protein [Lactococcus sp. DD01]|nr:hypothetical protein [Lactococcus sp. DD01]KXT59415.1 hypothetical protein LACDD01_02070 [Lactococcus sp. DD01]
MSKIKSSVEAAKEAVKPFLELELPEFEKVEINIPMLKVWLKVRK